MIINFKCIYRLFLLNSPPKNPLHWLRALYDQFQSDNKHEVLSFIYVRSYDQGWNWLTKGDTHKKNPKNKNDPQFWGHESFVLNSTENSRTSYFPYFTKFSTKGMDFIINKKKKITRNKFKVRIHQICHEQMIHAKIEMKGNFNWKLIIAVQSTDYFGHGMFNCDIKEFQKCSSVISFGHSVVQCQNDFNR